MDQLSKLKMLKNEFREFCSEKLVIRSIKDVFLSAGFSEEKPTREFSGSRNTLVESYYASVDWQKEDAEQKLLQVIRLLLLSNYLQEDDKDRIRSMCKRFDFDIDDESVEIDKFEKQFPAGLPFGKLKPDFAIKAENGRQTLKFELCDGYGIIFGEVYPDFDFKKLEEAYGITAATNRTLKIALVEMNQTDCEKKFFKEYAQRFGIAANHVPFLVPQPWIQWHSLSKKNLPSSSSLGKDDLYRLDFAAFWNNKRYAILIDDIGHYSVKHNKQWLASEENYAKRLKEDRKLKKESWQVFRVSNWEMRHTETLPEIFEDLRSFIGF